MKREQNRVCFYGACLSFLLSFGAVGAMVTGLELPVSGMWLLALICLSVSGLCAVSCRFGFGLPMLAVLLIGSSLVLWRADAAAEQTMAMLHRISLYYSRAYGWGVIGGVAFYAESTVVDYPLGIIALWVALYNCWNLCRGQSDWDGLLLAVLPVAACLVVNDTVPAPLYLYLWMLGFVLVLLTNGSRRRNHFQGNRMLQMAAVPAALALGLLFWAVPQEGYDKHPQQLQERIVNWVRELPDLWEDVSDEIASAVDGAVQTTQVELDSLGPRLKRVYPVMEVTAPVSGTIYLRGQDYDIYTGAGWTATGERVEYFPSNYLDRELGEFTIRTRRVRDVLYLPYYPAETVSIAGGSLENTDGLREYSFTQNGLPTSWRAMMNTMTTSAWSVPYFAGGLSSEQLTQQYLKLPEQTRAWATELLGRILSDEPSATAAAEAIAAYVRNSALYDLDTQRMSSDYEDFARWFLEESETGYCVHFATAATVLLRAAGIEARYVEGYMTEAVAGEEVTVTADQAHAWVEYYEPYLNAWLVLEATPADLSEEETIPSARETEESTEETGMETTPNLPDRPEENSESVSVSDTGGVTPGEKADRSWLWGLLAWILAPVILIFAVIAQRQLRLERRARQRRRGKPNARALQRWRELARLHRLLKTEPSAEAEQIAEKARYSQHSVTCEELRLLDVQIAAAKAQMQQRPWYLKFIDRYVFVVY